MNGASMPKTLIIAEAGVNHNGDMDIAKKLIEAAAEAKADIVKFQSFTASRLVSPKARKAKYQIEQTGAEESQFEMLKKLELSEQNHKDLIAHCEKCGIEFLSTPFDIESLKQLAFGFNIARIKLGSGETTNHPLLLETARTGKSLILSTGMSSLDEIEEALGALAFGYAGYEDTPSKETFRKAFVDPAAQEKLKHKVIILHCTSEYPTPPDHVNLKAMDTLREAFGFRVGFSDHTKGIHIPVAAVARGACVIEKHFTLDRNMEGPDHKASLEPDELAEMVAAIRDVEQALGDGVKRPASDDELDTKSMAQKSLYAAKDVPEGHVLTEGDIIVLRPGPAEGGLPPSEYWEVLGKRTGKALKQYDPLTKDILL